MTPILYTFRRCPYAIRARLALQLAEVNYHHREVLLRDKPVELLKLSLKGTVPVLQLQTSVIDESLDIMRWALVNHAQKSELDHPLVKQNDTEFKYFLDRYKYFDRYPQQSQTYYLQQALPFISKLERALCKSASEKYYLGAGQRSPLELAVLPFVRQFVMVDRARFETLGFDKLIDWLDASLTSEWFQAVMIKVPRWEASE